MNESDRKRLMALARTGDMAAVIQGLKDAGEVEKTPECPCYRCVDERDKADNRWPPTTMIFMILCPLCGNKRCPHGTDHRNACTGSNEPNQPGSRYQYDGRVSPDE